MLQETSEAGPGLACSSSAPPARPLCTRDGAGILAVRIAAGDTGAEAELVDRYGRILRALVRHWGQTEAEDMAQETLCIALKCLRAGHLRKPESLRPFLEGVAWNVVRRARRRWRMEAEACREPWPRVRPFPLPDETVQADELTCLLGAALGRLAWRDREVLFSFYLREDDKPAICRRLALSSSQFDMVKFRALRRLLRLTDGSLNRRASGRERPGRGFVGGRRAASPPRELVRLTGAPVRPRGC
jgi:DNA-directed RNA polymerase specialized sigma24 family protein